MKSGRVPRAGADALLICLLLVLAFAAGCLDLSQGPPTQLLLSAASDTTIRITWTVPGGSLPDSYVIAFKETGTSAWLDVGSAVDSATQADHNPSGRTGQYRVTAVYGTRSYSSIQNPTSTPVHSSVMLVGELNSTTHSGYGWDRDSGAGSLFTMRYASNADNVDFYVTDWTVGFAGPAYYVASPDWGQFERGGSGYVPVGSWRPNRFASLATDVRGPLAPFDSAAYVDILELRSDSSFAAVVCTDTITVSDTTDTFVTVSRHYALVKFGRPDAANGTVQAETWFQAIRNLRLIQH